MRVAVDHQATSLQDAGGISRYHYELARHLRGRDDVSLDLLLGGQSSILQFAQLAGANLRVKSWTSRLPPGYSRYAMNALWTAAVAPRSGRFDVYHTTYQRWEPAIRHRALVATHHDSTQERFPALFRNAAAIRARKRRLYDRADMVICVSESARRDLEEIYGLDAAKTRVVHHGVMPIANHSDDPAGGGSQAAYLLYVGSRSPYKNFLALLQALAATEDAVPLVVAGGGPWTEDERATIAATGLEGRVTLHPRAPEEQLEGLYRDATLLVYPSLYEGFGLPPLEAMSAGCPVLVSGSSSLPEICGDAAFYFDPATPGSLSAALSRLLADPVLLRSKVADGRAWVRRYTWEQTAEATLAIYREVAGDAFRG